MSLGNYLFNYNKQRVNNNFTISTRLFARY